MKLIFNAGSGKPEESPQQLAIILSEMQDHEILPEVYTVRPDSLLEAVVRKAIKTGIKSIVVAGGDGTIDRIVGAMIGSDAILGIIPTGTRNNVAFNQPPGCSDHHWHFHALVVGGNHQNDRRPGPSFSDS